MQSAQAAPPQIAPSGTTSAAKSSAAKAESRGTARSSSKPEVQTQGPVLMAPPLRLTAGKSMLLQLSENAERLSVGNPDVADVMLINPREIYLLGKKTGSTNLFVWSVGGATSLRDVTVHVDTDALQSRLREWVPTADGVQVDSVSDTLVVRGRVADAMKAQRIMGLAEAFSGGKKAVNMLRVEGGQRTVVVQHSIDDLGDLRKALGPVLDAYPGVPEGW